MPYRRLPNTDKSRLKSLKKAFKKYEKDGPDSVPFSEASITVLRAFLPTFQHALINLEAAKNNQVEKNKEYIELYRKAKMYVSHYIQVMNFAINRGELKAEIREFYELDAYENSLPPLSTEKDLLTWGKKTIEGDRNRIMHGGSPIYNPSIALVKVHFEKFADAYHFQKTLQSITDRSANNVNDLREEADKLILQIWNETENTFESLPDSLKREKAEKYGVIYVFRKSEIKKMEADKLQSKLSL